MSNITGTSRSRTTSQTNRGDNEEDKRRGEDNEETKEESDKAALVEVVQQLYMMFQEQRHFNQFPLKETENGN